MISEEQTEQSLQVPTPSTPGRIRSHSLKPQHSRIDYARRKSAADVSSTIVTCWDTSGEQQSAEALDKTPSPSWLKRRFTFFSLEQPMIDDKRRMTTDRLSFFDEKSYSELLKQKRPSLIAQMMEVERLFGFLQRIYEQSIMIISFLFQSFVRRISSRKKKRGNDRDRDREEGN